MTNYSPSIKFLLDHGIITEQQAEDATALSNGIHPVEILLRQQDISKTEADLAMSCESGHFKKRAKAASQLAKHRLTELQRSIKEVNTLIKHVNIWS